MMFLAVQQLMIKLLLRTLTMLLVEVDRMLGMLLERYVYIYTFESLICIHLLGN